MDRILNQFRRIYADNGSGDVDFTEPEEKLRIAKARLAKEAQGLVRAAENLNRAALAAGFPKGAIH